MVTWKGILYDGEGLLDDEGVPLIYDADESADPPEECCCPVDLCGTGNFSDDFSTTKAEWSDFDANFTTNWAYDSGRLRPLNNSVVAIICRKTPENTTVSIEAECDSVNADNNCGVQFGTAVLSGIYILFRPTNGDFRTDFGTIAQAPVDGDVVKIELDVTTGGTVTERRYYINGVLKSTQGASSVASPEYFVGVQAASESDATTGTRLDNFAYTEIP